MFSRLASRLRGETNPLYKLKEEFAASGGTVVDLTSGNVTETGILFPQSLLQDILRESVPKAAVYRPDTFGQLAARETVSRYYREQGVIFPPEQILLTPGSSFAYWYCFKLLADEGDEILCPRPSYPLFDYIAALSGVAMIPYRLDEERGWAIDLENLENSISTRTRALVVISPHNPTGRVATEGELEQVAQLASRHDLAIIADEVFNEFLLARTVLPRPAGGRAPLVLTLNGLSKMFALPGIKFGWMAVSGEPARVRAALRALELIADTFLPVNEIVQAAVPAIFGQGREFLASYKAEVRNRWQITRELLARSPRCGYCAPDGGFYVTLHIQREEEPAAEDILRHTGALVHPGYFYDIDPHHLVFSFTSAPEVLRGLVPRILEHL